MTTSITLPAFRPKIRVDIQKPGYRIKTIENNEELEKVLELRAEVFFRERLGDSAPPLDIDVFDSLCDHMAIIDEKENRWVGTYRLIASSFSDRFYSATEFDISNLLQSPGVKLELGRACVDRTYRNGTVFKFLWRGIRAYIDQVKARYLFGCASIPTVDPVETAAICLYMKQNDFILTDVAAPRPLASHRFPSLPELPASKATPPLTSPLLAWYLNAGARVAPEPALDRTFQCIDFLTWMETEQFYAPFERRFGD